MLHWPRRGFWSLVVWGLDCVNADLFLGPSLCDTLVANIALKGIETAQKLWALKHLFSGDKYLCKDAYIQGDQRWCIDVY